MNELSIIVDEVKAASIAAGIMTPLKFANIREFNAFAGSFEFDEFPVNVLVPFTIEGTIGSNPGGTNKQVLPLQGWVLTRIDDDQDIEDYRSEKIEHKYMAPMRALAIKFLLNLADSDIVDSDAGDILYRVQGTYAFLAHRLFGVQYNISLPIDDSICR